MPEKLISELLDLPERVHKGDFVLNLSKGVTEPEKTVANYVVTPQLVECFDDAMGFIRSGIDEANSKACYLHGSFGSGKSHFMAVLHLLLQHNPAVRSIDELAQICAKHNWVETKKFLLVPYHMIGARNMESAILGGYVDHVTKLHPETPLPGVYLADEIFQNAQQHRTALGDEKFFKQLNQGQTGNAGGWGQLAAGWDAERFESALLAPPSSDERSRLVGDLVQYIFPAFRGIAQGKDEAYVDLDNGLSIISSHAKALGYDGLILFLDELILWLASHAADLGFVQREGNKLAKLVEARRAERPAPIISFVARQRDLKELIGEGVTGVEQLTFADVLSHWEGRFHKITLEDRNLPVIAQKRVLKPKNAACRAELQQAFEQTAQVRTEIMEVLLTREADRAIFKMVYPFSPALIQALVAISSALQRERTALKIMLQLLVNRRDTLRLGDVIPLGDLWDVVAHGDEAFADVMRMNFDNAKKLYHNKLLPMLEQQHGIDFEVDSRRAQTDSAVASRLQLFVNDDRIVKSLLLSALVHGVEALSNMTCVRLAALNHGTIRSRIPGREHQVVAQKVRSWAGSVGEIRVSEDPTNPIVTLQLSGVDTESIIDSAKSFDNFGARQHKLRRMLFDSLGIEDSDELFIVHNFHWRGSARSCDIIFLNARTTTDEQLRSTNDWKVVIDFPFDSEGHSPVEDLDRLEKFRERNDRERTIVWLPTFFSPRTQTELRKLVIIDKLLVGNNLDQHSQHLSSQDRHTARLLLQNQQSALSHGLTQAVEAAYGIRPEPKPGTLDTSYDLADAQFQSLFPPLTLQPPVATNLGEAMIHLLDQALSHQFPKHPKFEQEVKRRDLQKVLETLQEAVRTTDGRVYVEDKAQRVRLRNICNPLGLGQMSETHFVLENSWKNHFTQMLNQSGKPQPTVTDLRAWCDLPYERGLLTEVQNLLILVYADQTNRSFIRYGTNYSPKLETLPDDVELQEQRLPDGQDWAIAVTRGGEIFGIAASGLLNATNLAAFGDKVKEVIGQFKADCHALPDRLQLIMRDLGLSEDLYSQSARVRTALAVRVLIAGCESREATDLVGVLARAKLETNGTAMGKSLKSAHEVLDLLRNTQWDLFSAVRRIQGDRQGAAEMLISDLGSWLLMDEHALAGGLRDKLAQAGRQAVQLLTPPSAPPPSAPVPTGTAPLNIDPVPPTPGWRVVRSVNKARMSHAESIVEAQELLGALQKNSKLRLSGQWTLEEES